MLSLSYRIWKKAKTGKMPLWWNHKEADTKTHFPVGHLVSPDNLVDMI